MNLARRTVATPTVTSTLLVAVVALPLLYLRRPEAIAAAEPWAESLPVFYLPTFFNDPFAVLLTPYAGYLHLVPRLIALAERLVNPAAAPTVSSALALVVTALVAAYLTNPRLGSVLPERWQRYAFATVLICAPAVYELLGVDVSLYIYLSVFLVAVAVAVPSSTRVGRITEIVAATLAGLSGPFSVFFLPLFWIRRNALSVVMTICATVQLGFWLSSPTRSIVPPDIGTVLTTAALRINVAVLGGIVAAYVPLVVSIVLVAAVAFIAFRGIPVRSWAPFAFAAMVVAAAGIAVTGPAIAGGVAAGERYFLLATMAVAIVVIRGIASSKQEVRMVARFLGAVMVVGFLLGFRVEPFQDGTWADRSRCIGSASPCTVHVVPERFSVKWPGSSGHYAPPRTWPPDD